MRVAQFLRDQFARVTFDQQSMRRLDVSARAT